MKGPIIFFIFVFAATIVFVLLKTGSSNLHKRLFLYVNNTETTNVEVTERPNATNRTHFVKEKNTKYILYWSMHFDRKDFYFGLGRVFNHCPIYNCYSVYDKNVMPEEEYDALLFHARNFERNNVAPPKKRLPSQYYVYSNTESPLHTGTERFKNFYNWTMTYRLDSDLLRNYGFVVKLQVPYTPPTLTSIAKKPGKIAWFASNCHTPSKREVLVKELQKYIPVDVYGGCGPNKCGISWSYSTTSKEIMCYRMLERKYKFYLSFENSICNDYVTEKLFNVLKLNVLPIVYGGANYTTFAPPKSVINVADFNSVKDLADHINFLDANSKEYLKYFEWKKDYVVDNKGNDVMCDLCAKLNDPSEKRTLYDDVTHWYKQGNDQRQCRIAGELPKIVTSIL